MELDFTKTGYVPDSVTVYNNVQIRVGGPERIVAQLRVEGEEAGKQYSLQTGSIDPGETKGLFYTYNKTTKFKVVIETNYVSTWTSTKWEVVHTEELAEGGYTYVVDGTPEEVVVRKFKK